MVKDTKWEAHRLIDKLNKEGTKAIIAMMEELLKKT